MDLFPLEFSLIVIQTRPFMKEGWAEVDIVRLSRSQQRKSKGREARDRKERKHRLVEEG